MFASYVLPTCFQWTNYIAISEKVYSGKGAEIFILPEGKKCPKLAALRIALINLCLQCTF